MGDVLQCQPEEKASREAENGVAQLDYIEYLVNSHRAREVRESHILELHSLAIQNIYPCGGKYRDARRRVTIEGSAHVPPHESQVPTLVRDLIDEINVRCATESAIWRAALALWRLNWIHPFAGGNGRTSRALSYLILCMDMEMTLPGVPSMPTLIYEHRDEYVQALRAVDASARDSEVPDLCCMEAFLQDIVTRQLASAIDKLTKAPT
ncbi:Fic family protein [Haliangium sp.]|uniref:Fic family protein n=1 Tax=Haliangium sp. TaxID=2663208 RepID=UPI003D128747